MIGSLLNNMILKNYTDAPGPFVDRKVGREDAQRVIQELEGDEGHKHLDEYSDSSTERGQCLLKSICEKFGFDSLGYQSLDGVLEAIGIDRDKVCTYCWNGKE